MKKVLSALGATAVAVVLLAGPAAAHVEPTISEAPAGGYATFALVIPHGCDGEGGDTVAVSVEMPEGVESATPEAIAGWEATVDDSGPVVVTWEGGPLPHDQFQEFGLSIQMPDTPGETALFPTVQTCESGEELAWIEADHDAENPAPAIAITESEGEHSHGAEATDEHADEHATDTTATDEHATETAAAADDSGDDGSSNTLAVVALIVGLLGLGAGGYAIVSSRRAS